MSFFPFILPDSCKRIAVRMTSRNYMGQQVIATRKIYEPYHTISYFYSMMSSRQFRIIEDFFRSMDGGVTSFWVVDWSDPRPIAAISGDMVTVNNVQGFSINTGDGGNKVLLWQNSGDYGDASTVSGKIITDKTKAWDTNEWQSHRVMDSVGNLGYVASNDIRTITVSGATPVSGAYDIFRNASNAVSVIDTANRQVTLSASPGMTYSAPLEKFVLPVYECYFSQDSLGLEPTETFNFEPNDNYGPYFSGRIEFIQSGTGT